MTNFKTSRKNYIIKKRLEERQAKGLPSIPETNFNEYQTERKLGLEWLTPTKKTFRFRAIDGFPWNLQLDFVKHKLHPDPKDPIPFEIDFEIDGVKWHKKPSKEEWKNELKNSHGLRVIHIPEEITAKVHWAYLDEKLPAAITSNEMTIYIAG